VTDERGDDSLMTVAQAAALLSVPTSWIYAHAESGELPSFRVGKYRRFDRAELITWLRAQRQAGPPTRKPPKPNGTATTT